MSLPAPLLVVTERHGAPRPLTETVRALLDGGARWIWFRDRDLEAGARRDMALALREVVQRVGGFLTIGADSALAAEIGADGVHLDGSAGPEQIALARRRLGAGGRVGVSAHSLADLRAAREAGADYATLSPIFSTPSKPGYGPALGLDALGTASALDIPVIGLGGVGPEEARACRMAGAAGVAVMGGLMRAADPAEATRRYLTALRL